MVQVEISGGEGRGVHAPLIQTMYVKRVLRSMFYNVNIASVLN